MNPGHERRRQANEIENGWTMSQRIEILSKIGEGKTVEALIKEQDMREPTIRAMIDSMEYEGYLETIRCGGAGCRICAKGCTPPLSTTTSTTGIKMYGLTEKGMEFINTA